MPIRMTNLFKLNPGPLMRLAALCLLAGQAHAQDAAHAFPQKAVRLIVTAAVGQSTDLNARLLAGKLSSIWGQPVVVEQKVGGSGSLGTEIVAKSAPDGYAILVTTTGLVQNVSMRKSLPYDIFKDLAPISQVAIARLLFAIDSREPVNTLGDFVRLAKANPAKYNFGSFGVGSTAHLALEQLNNEAKIKVVHVPYAGTQAAVRAILAGEVTVALLDLAVAKPQVVAGKIRLLASTGNKRSPFTPDVPTFGEAGVTGFGADNWVGWVAPGGTPDAVVTKVADDLRQVMNMPDVKAWYANAGLEIANNTPAQFADIIKKDTAYWATLVRNAGIQPE